MTDDGLDLSDVGGILDDMELNRSVSAMSHLYKGGTKAAKGFLEELIVRRELSMNFCHYTPDYDEFSNLPGWAK